MNRKILWTSLFALSFAHTAARPGFGQETKQTEQPPVALAERHNFSELERECLEVIDSDDKCRAIAQRLEDEYPQGQVPEAILMLCAILRGGDMGSGGGWFKPAEKKRDWNWLAKHCGKNENESISYTSFRGSKLLFERLDRNGDGRIDATDLDWSMNSQWMREAGVINSLFRSLDQDGNAKLSRKEWIDFFEGVCQGADEFGIDAFRREFPLARWGGYRPGDEPNRERLIRGFFSSEVGSHCEGPHVGDQAPDFELSKFDDKETIRLSTRFGSNPTVLVFGNYTCGPFRRLFPEFDVFHQIYKQQAQFLGIYVREAHPSDGWMMESNSSVGVKLRQPRTMQERKQVAETCATKLNYSFPLLVDTIDDQVGNAYSGMPARAYVIDREGIVVYKSGRGPFGFIPGELEQALLLELVARDVKPN